MKLNLFAYGTLVIPSVFSAVVGRSFESADARLAGYSRFTLRDKIYPGIVKNSDGEVDGCVYFDLDSEAIDRLSFFEDDLYQQNQVQVLFDGGKTVSALAYVISQSELLTDEEWSIEEFERRYLEEYLRDACEYMLGYSGEM